MAVSGERVFVAFSTQGFIRAVVSFLDSVRTEIGFPVATEYSSQSSERSGIGRSECGGETLGDSKVLDYGVCGMADTRFVFNLLEQ